MRCFHRSSHPYHDDRFECQTEKLTKVMDKTGKLHHILSVNNNNDSVEIAVIGASEFPQRSLKNYGWNITHGQFNHAQTTWRKKKLHSLEKRKYYRPRLKRRLTIL
jgi:hypothetical protein